MKGIASQIIGKEKVYAIGIAFYYSKKKKPVRMPVMRTWQDSSSPDSYKNNNYYCDKSNHFYDVSDIIIGGDVSDDSYIGSLSVGDMTNFVNIGSSISCSSVDMARGMNEGKISLTNGLTNGEEQTCGVLKIANVKKETVKTVKPVKKLEVGAGALINQKIYRDTEDIDYWQDEPAGMLYINYCDMETLSNVLEAGKIKKKKEGFMKGLKVGS